MNLFTPLPEKRLYSKEIPQYILYLGMESVDKLGDMCIRKLDCPIALLQKVAVVSHFCFWVSHICFT